MQLRFPPLTVPGLTLVLPLMLLGLAGCATDARLPLQPIVDALLEAPVLHPDAVGEAIDLGKPLTPRALAVIAVIANPDLRAARAQAKVADAQVIAAGLLPDPTVNLSYDRRLSGPDPFDGLGAQVIYELTALRDRRLALGAARATRDQVRLDLEWSEWQTAGQARLLATRIAGLERVRSLLALSGRASDGALDRGLAAAARGDIRADEVSARRLAASDASDKVRQAERDLNAARLDLNALLGEPPSARLVIDADPASEPALDADAFFARARVSRLDLRALEAGYRSQEVAVRKAIWDAFPTLQLTVNRARDTANNQTLGPAVNFTLPIWNRNLGGIAAARATRAQLAAEYAARVFALRAQISDLCQALTIDRRRRAELVAQIGPLDRIAARNEQAAAIGDLSRAAAETVGLSVRDKAIALAMLDQSIAEQTVALELAVGAPGQGLNLPRTAP